MFGLKFFPLIRFAYFFSFRGIFPHTLYHKLFFSENYLTWLSQLWSGLWNITMRWISTCFYLVLYFFTLFPIISQMGFCLVWTAQIQTFSLTHCISLGFWIYNRWFFFYSQIKAGDKFPGCMDRKMEIFWIWALKWDNPLLVHSRKPSSNFSLCMRSSNLMKVLKIPTLIFIFLRICHENILCHCIGHKN